MYTQKHIHIPIFLQQNNAYIIYKHTYRCECIDIIWERKYSKAIDGLSKDFHTKYFLQIIMLTTLYKY